MNMKRKKPLGRTLALVAALRSTVASPAVAVAASPKSLKAEAVVGVEAQASQVQVMVDQGFRFAEPGFQEGGTSDYLAWILERNGFTVARRVGGITPAFTPGPAERRGGKGWGSTGRTRG